MGKGTPAKATMYLVIDTTSRNVLGEFENVVAAKTFFLELVAADPPVARELKILSNTGERHSVPAKSVREAAAHKGVSAQLVS